MKAGRDAHTCTETGSLAMLLSTPLHEFRARTL